MADSSSIRKQCLKELNRREASVTELKAFVGLDGFVDEIIHAVDKREDATTFQRIPSLSALAERIAGAAGHSTNIELVPQKIKLGGNGPILANALGAFGVGVTYVGALGHPNLHPVFAPLANKGDVYSIAEPAHTDALEFSDGKLMLGKMTPLNDVTWDNIAKRMGRSSFQEKLRNSHLVSFVNWTMVPYLSDIWQAILDEEMLADSGQTAFFDLCDPEKRNNDDILEAMNLLGRFRKKLRVILGLNEKEALELAEIYGVTPGTADPESRCALAEALFRHLNVDLLVIHPVAYALVTSERATTWTPGPLVENPVLTTGAGDHFNAGFCLGLLLDMSPELSVQLGVTTSGFYVRTGKSPCIPDLKELLANWPTPHN